MTEMVMDYTGHRITVNDNFTFNVSGPMFNEDKHPREYASADEAKAAIHERINAESEAAKAAAIIAEPMLGPKGERVVVKGIHTRLGNIIFGARLDIADRDDLYPDHPEIASLLEERRMLKAREREIEGVLRRFAVKVSRSYGNIKASDYPALIEKLKNEIVAARKDSLDYSFVASKMNQLGRMKFPG